ncbi:MAG: hypothetical protein HZC26_02105, partial [Candidatus Magasanikbacteria bacterium]|nr:hypothetical protein [Candidatus Magasanikbacteria bacterium]
VARFLARLEIPDPIARWYMETIDRIAQDSHDLSRATMATRDKARYSTERQLARLTDLRVRNVVRDEDYLEQREKLLGNLSSLEHPANVTEVFEPAKAVVLALNQAKKRFLVADDSQKRQIVQSICSNSILLDKKLLITAQKPFALMSEGRKSLITRKR